jgi:hypothetical protein
MGIYLAIAISVLALLGLIHAIRRQYNVTATYSQEEQSLNAKVFEESSKRVEQTVADQLAAKARDPRLASMTQ